MTPVVFPEANKRFGPPPGMAESQVRTIDAYCGTIEGGSLEGALVVVTAWQPSRAELDLLAAGKPIYLSFIGGLPPHLPTMDFHSATNLR